MMAVKFLLYQQQCLTMADSPAQEAEQITTPLLLHYAGLDSRVNEGWPAYGYT
jgi:carboxymethylenebutenolidase